MDLNDIQLHGTQLAALYSDALIELAPDRRAAAAPVAADAPPVRPAASGAPALPAYLGQHGKRILLVNDDPESVFIADADLEVLTKIMDRAGVGLADIAIVNWARLPKPDGTILLAALDSKQVLLFGIGPEAFGLAAVFPHYQIQKLAGRTYLAAPTVAELTRADNAVKTRFWTAFKSWLG